MGPTAHRPRCPAAARSWRGGGAGHGARPLSALPAPTRPRALAGRRILAWLQDWLWILVLPLLAVPLGWLLGRLGIVLTARSADVFGFFVLVVPATLWLAWREAAPRSATPGKRRQGLRVASARSGAAIGFGRALLRNVLKVAIPWQLGHTVAFGFATLGDGPVGAGLLAASLACYGLMIAYLAGLFLGTGRPLYDRISGTAVVQEPLP